MTKKPSRVRVLASAREWLQPAACIDRLRSKDRESVVRSCRSRHSGRNFAICLQVDDSRVGDRLGEAVPE
jgi:hypothetical protein